MEHDPQQTDESEKENAPGLMSFSPGTKCSESRFEKMKNRMAARNADLKKRQLERKQSTERKVLDLDAIEQSFREQVDAETIQNTEAQQITPQSSHFDLASAIRDGPFLVPANPLPDVSAIAFDRSPRVHDHSINFTNGPVSSTPLAQDQTRPRLHRAMTMHEGVFKTPLPPKFPASRSSSVDRLRCAAGSGSDTIISATPISSSDFVLTVDEKMQRQLSALSEWGNSLLRGGIDRDEVELGKTKEDAKNALSRLLSQKGEKAIVFKELTGNEKYKEWVQRRKMDEYRKRARDMFRSLNIEETVTRNIQYGYLSVRSDLKVYADIALQSVLLRLLFSFHPLWLHLGLEVIFKKKIDVGPEDNFVLKIARFCQENLFLNQKLLKMKKMSKNGKIALVTEEGSRALHSHFLQRLSLLFIFIEEAKRRSIIPHSPRMFNRTSSYKCLPDVFSEVSREILSASGKPYAKVLQNCGFQSTYKQAFFEDYIYRLSAYSDLGDGIILAKLVEIICEDRPNSLMMKLRNPGGDRIRKIGNVQVVLDALSQAGVDTGAITASQVVGCQKAAVLELLWRMVGFYMERCGSFSLPVRYLPVFGNTTILRFERINNEGEGQSADSENDDRSGRLLQLCKEFGRRVGAQVSSWGSLRDGLALSEMWRLYTGNVPPLENFPGSNAFEKVYNAADAVLGVPRCVFDDDRSISLFVRFLVEKLADLHVMHQAATNIQQEAEGEDTRSSKEQEVPEDERTEPESDSLLGTLDTQNSENRENMDAGPESSSETVTSSEHSALMGATYVVLDDGCEERERDAPLERALEDPEQTLKEEQIDVNGITADQETDVEEGGLDSSGKREMMESALTLVQLANSGGVAQTSGGVSFSETYSQIPEPEVLTSDPGTTSVPNSDTLYVKEEVDSIAEEHSSSRVAAKVERHSELFSFSTVGDISDRPLSDENFGNVSLQNLKTEVPSNEQSLDDAEGSSLLPNSEFDFYKVDIEQMVEKADKIREFLNGSGDELSDARSGNVEEAVAEVEDEVVEGEEDEEQQEDDQCGTTEEEALAGNDGGLVLERAVIDGELSFGWTEEEPQICELDNEPQEEQEGEISDGNPEDEEGRDELFVDLQEAKFSQQDDDWGVPVKPPAESSVGGCNWSLKSNPQGDDDPFTGFEVFTDLTEVRREMEEEMGRMVSLQSVSQVSAEPSNTPDSTQRYAKKETCTSATSIAGRSSTETGGLRVAQMEAMFASRPPPNERDPLPELYRRFKKLQQDQAVMKNLIKSVQSKLGASGTSDSKE